MRLVVSPAEPPTAAPTTATAVVVALLTSSPTAYALESASTATLCLTTTLATTAEDSPTAASEAAGPSRCARVIDDRECGFFLGELDGERVVGLICTVCLLIYCKLASEQTASLRASPSSHNVDIAV